MKNKILFLIALALLCPTAWAREVLPGPIPAELVEVIDGDSFKVVAHIWPGLYQRVTIRLNGIDTPELKGKCALEKQKAHEAREKLQALMGSRVVLLSTVQPDKYNGRVVANASVLGRDLAKQLIESGLARPYDGGKRGSWCP